MTAADFIVVGGGSAGSVLAAELARREAGSVLLLEAGPTERHPLVSMPFGLVWLMGSRRDWAWQTVPMAGVNGRRIGVPRGRMLGGSGSINSMVWFRGRMADFDGWGVPGWAGRDVLPAFEAVEEKLDPVPLAEPHPLTRGLGAMLPSNHPNPTPDYESAGVFRFNLHGGRRRSAADAFLRPALERGGLAVQTGAPVDCLLWQGDRAAGVRLADGTEIGAAKGVVLCAGSLASPAILMRSGLGPKADLAALDIPSRVDAPGIGANLHDHPGVGLHFEGPGSGYGLEPRQWAAWATAPFRYLAQGRGRLASPTVEGGAFFNARGTSAEPDVQSHFIPFMLNWRGPKYPLSSGYFADVCVCRPKSRGQLRLASKEARAMPLIDLGLLSAAEDLETLAAGITRLRALLAEADFGPHRAVEGHPGPEVVGEALKAHIRASCGTAYHPVGTLALGGPVDARCRVEGVRGLWAADASLMPQVTSANTNAPSMMIGWRGAKFIAEEAA